MRLLKYYYYHVYTYYSKEPAPLLKVFAVSFVGVFFNFLTIASFLSIILKTRFTFFVVGQGIGRLWPLLFLLPSYGIFLYYFKNIGYHERIMKAFSNEQSNQKPRGGVLVILYFVSSIALFPLSLYIRIKVEGY
jgi:hypothetical protein